MARTGAKNRANDSTSDTNLGESTELFAMVSGIAWLAARLPRCICTRSQRGVERISGVVHDVHSGEGQKRCVGVEADL
jgi:hypothetical protein